MVRLNRALLLLAAASFLYVGISGLLSPVSLTEPIDLEMRGPSAVNEIRANYGGMHLAIGLLFLAGALVARARRPATILLAVFAAGLVFGRIVSIVVDGVPGLFVLPTAASRIVISM
jgi:hypothetical protein